VYTGPVGSAALTTQIHDYNVHTDVNDVFWMIPVRHDAVDVDFHDGTARLRVKDLGVFDDHDIANSLTLGLGLNGDKNYPFPAIAGVAPARATVSFDVEWSGIVDMKDIHNSGQSFMGTFLSTGATIEWSAEQPGFKFESEAANPARNLISVLGCEQNGMFFK
jgi:hypothetical protein